MTSYDCGLLEDSSVGFPVKGPAKILPFTGLAQSTFEECWHTPSLQLDDLFAQTADLDPPAGFKAHMSVCSHPIQQSTYIGWCWDDEFSARDAESIAILLPVDDTLTTRTELCHDGWS